MTQPLPIDVTPLLTPLPDPAHDQIRATTLDAIQRVWANHLDLLGKLTAAQGALDAATGALAALTDRVAALENPAPAPTPAPAP